RRADLLEQLFPLFGSEPLGIVDAPGDAVGIEHDRGRDHRPRQRTAAGLVASRHRPDAPLEQRTLSPKVRRCYRNQALRQFFWLLVRLSNHAGMVLKQLARRNLELGQAATLSP